MARAIRLHHAGVPHAADVVSKRSPIYQAYQVLHWGFCALPVIAGLDKFANLLVTWDKYLAPQVVRALPIPAHTLMLAAGVVEILAGLVVAIKPKIGAYVVAAWLVGIIANLLLSATWLDVALRDFGLMLSALALGRLATHFDRRADARAGEPGAPESVPPDVRGEAW
jgi:uncharacterized membrane protein YphA (DoxX/SURF4 family)